MYILIIARGYPTKKTPQIGIFEFDQAKALHNLGHKIIYTSIDLRSIRRWRKWGMSCCLNEGIEVYNVSIPLGRVPWRILLFFGKKGLLYLYKKIKERNGKPDIVHAHFTLCGAISSVLKKTDCIPLIVTEHNSIIHRSALTKEILSIGKIAYENADKLISVSLSLSKRIKQHFDIDSIVVHNIVDTSSFFCRKKAENNKFTFISVGDLINGKGYDLLIEAFHKANFNNDVYLYIIGGGPLQSQLQKEIETIGFINQIKLLGRMSRHEIGQIMQKCNAFVLASRGETFGVVYIEAMLAGLPVIATECGGPEEFVNENNGILIPVDNVELLTKGMINLYNNIDKYDGEQISQKCRQNYSPEIIGTRLSQIYSEVLNT
jgi:L-malate glycosyltransferase